MIALITSSTTLSGNDDFDLDLGQQADAVLLAAIDGGVPLLAAVAAHVGHRHARDVQLLERVADVVHLVRADDGLNRVSCVSSSMRSRTASLSEACSRRRELPPPLGDVQHVDGLLALGGNQHQIDVAPLPEITRLMR